MITIRYVTNEDKRFWFELDKHLPEAEFDKKVRDRQGYVLFENNEPVGILRYNLFWDNTPFCTMLYMKSLGYGMVLTSTREDEEAQYFYRKLGYEDCGNLDLFYPGFEQPTELLLSKKL